MSGEEGEGENDGDGDGKGGGGDGDCGDGDDKSHGEGKPFLAHVAAQISTIRVSAGSGAIQLMSWLRKKPLSSSTADVHARSGVKALTSFSHSESPGKVRNNSAPARRKSSESMHGSLTGNGGGGDGEGGGGDGDGDGSGDDCDGGAIARAHLWLGSVLKNSTLRQLDSELP